MPISPGVYTKEIDLTTTVPSPSASEGGFAGVFSWGYVDQLILVDSEPTLVDRVGKPNINNFEGWFTCSNFLGYTDALYISRAYDANTLSAVANTGALNVANQLVKNPSHYETVTFDANAAYIARCPGDLGNSLKISSVDSANAYSQDIDLVANSSVSNTTTETYFSVAAGANTGTLAIMSGANASVAFTVATNIMASVSVGDLVLVGNSTIGQQYLQVSAKGALANTSNGSNYTTTATLSFTSTFNTVTNASSQTLKRRWQFFNEVDRAPGTSQWLKNLGGTVVDEMHVIVIDEDGKFTGKPGMILERYEGLSRATDAKSDNGSSLYFKTVLNTVSRYVWAGSPNANAVSNTALNVVDSTNYTPQTLSFAGGADGGTESGIAIGSLAQAWDKFVSPAEVDVSILMQGKARGTGGNYAVLANYIMNNIVEKRQDVVLAASPAAEAIVNQIDPVTGAVTFRNNCVSSSYLVLDSGYKYQYDKYNDTYRWVPLNGDIAGCMARTEAVAEYFYAPGGATRGQIKNVVKLAYNPTETQREVLYKADINPVGTFPGEGTMLYGNKTALGRPSYFSRINVRRLFIGLKKVIARAARAQMFEFNDEFARNQFIAMVTPPLRDVKGKRGIYGFEVVCNSDNNTEDVINNFGFVGDILIKPGIASEIITLNFVNVPQGLQFSEASSLF